MHKIIVIGGGAAGMIAAITAAKKNNRVILLEKNEKLGKKVYITGKGRCNLTNNVLPNEFFNNVVSNPKFVYSCINKFSSQDTINFFENNGFC
jgi:predicted flavoprotein YhiN